ncbi:hypothetical protein EIP91_011180 [Steccherinum ochraceum]|uniref:Fungal-type protein kinase domain-containing protein n=1 Tax=Steccherinum ochraceum TaxID=92696 RepID=A0A4R0RIW0_9APHY|nr:hypothetical protein EIP91_011180 [Steccherinum ochraceum]
MDNRTWVGPLDPRDFMQALMKVEEELPRAEVSKTCFGAVPLECNSETDICKRFMDAIICSKLLPEEFYLNVNDHPNEISLPLLSVHRGQESGSPWSSMEFGIMFRTACSADPFPSEDGCGSSPQPSTSKAEERTWKKLASCAAAQFDHQHRSFLFTILVCGHHARFLRWDRAGIIVTDQFDYKEDPQPLAEYLWRYGRISATNRGFDPTVRCSTSSDQEAFRHALQGRLESLKLIPGAERTLDDRFPCYTITVAGSAEEPRSYVVRRPISSPSSPTGRATRAYIALDIASQELVFLKDYWRPLESSHTPEAEVYRALEDVEVPHLPRIRMAGDVRGGHQVTSTNRWQRLEGIWDCGPIRGYRHHRIVQDLAYPLSAVRSSRQLAQALRNVVICIAIACRISWLHRDISSGNVMLGTDGEGLLNDWDHGFRLDPKNKIPSSRTGTWRYLSLALSQDAKKVHDVLDDLESCFWVLLYQSLHFFASTADVAEFNLFDYQSDRLVDSEIVGGAGKAKFLFGRGKSFHFTCKPLQDLIESLRRHFLASHVARCAAGETLPEHLEDPATPVLAIFDAALSRTDWPESDVLEEQSRVARHGSASVSGDHPTSGSLHHHSSQAPNSAPASLKVEEHSSRGSAKHRLDESDTDDSASTKSSRSKRLKSDATPPSSPLRTPSPTSRARTRSAKIEADERLLRRVTRSQTSLGRRIARSQRS